jgi:hypothetical protein
MIKQHIYSSQELIQPGARICEVLTLAQMKLDWMTNFDKLSTIFEKKLAY